jgi:hypothetical protein
MRGVVVAKFLVLALWGLYLAIGLTRPAAVDVSARNVAIVDTWPAAPSRSNVDIRRCGQQHVDRGQALASKSRLSDSRSTFLPVTDTPR